SGLHSQDARVKCGPPRKASSLTCYNSHVMLSQQASSKRGLVGRFRLAVLLLLAALALSPQVVQGQNQSKPPAAPQKPPAASQTTPTITKNVNLVNVLFTVTNNKKQLVTGLTKSDFEVFEDNRPQTVEFFTHESNLPLRIGVLIDTSNSVRERLGFEKQAAIDFLNAAVRPGEDEAFVVGFDVEPELLQDYTDDVGKLSDAIRELQAGGGTGLFDAIYYACKEKMIYVPEPVPYLRRVLIIVSDGEDNESQHSLDEALAMAQRAEAIIFAVSTNRSGLSDRGDKVLTTLANQTGGRAFFPFEASDLSSSFAAITKELRSQYSLAYLPTDSARDGTFRHIRIKPLEKGLHVSARTGYFAPSS
ncbi:MAG: VWA domain-containing protein, partial [Acidobacteriota bacterium]|nr:VWA domain-containing protein [Acidobacteriota bacterium]